MLVGTLKLGLMLLSSTMANFVTDCPRNVAGRWQCRRLFMKTARQESLRMESNLPAKLTARWICKKIR
jgi:hypothetical protein